MSIPKRFLLCESSYIQPQKKKKKVLLKGDPFKTSVHFGVCPEGGWARGDIPEGDSLVFRSTTSRLTDGREGRVCPGKDGTPTVDHQSFYGPVVKERPGAKGECLSQSTGESLTSRSMSSPYVSVTDKGSLLVYTQNRGIVGMFRLPSLTHTGTGYLSSKNTQDSEYVKTPRRNLFSMF